MPKYRIEGSVYEAESPEEAYAQHDQAKNRQPDVTVTRIGDREIAPADSNQGLLAALRTATGKTARAAGPYLAAGAAGAAAGAPLLGVGAIPGAIAGMTAYGLGSTAADVLTSGRASQGVENVMTQMGLPELTGGLERTAAAGLRGALGGFSAARSAMDLSQARGLLPQTTTERVIGTMAERPATQTAAAGLAGAASQGASELGAPFPVAMGAGMVAGSAPFMARGGRPITDSRLGKQPPQQNVTQTPAGAAGQMVQDMPSNAIRALHAERLQRFGIPLTPAQMSGNPAAQTAESGLPQTGSPSGWPSGCHHGRRPWPVGAWFQCASRQVCALGQSRGNHHCLSLGRAAGARLLLTEDLHPGFCWRGVRAVNPWRSRLIPCCCSC